eukprot:COSAG02_NODE_4915_length_4837_cov_6.226467_1_plen_44_part_10
MDVRCRAWLALESLLVTVVTDRSGLRSQAGGADTNAMQFFKALF